MNTSRRVRLTFLAVMSLATAGAVMAARPGAGTIQGNADFTSAATPAAGLSQASSTQSVVIPDDLQNHRLKVRLSRDLGARLLPDGRLFSMKGRDLTGVAGLLDSLAVQLSPATTIPESELQRLRRRATMRSGGSFADIGATFWVNGNPEEMGHVARRLARLTEFEVVSFARQAPQPAVPITRHRDVRGSQQVASRGMFEREQDRPIDPALETIREYKAQQEDRLRDGLIAGLEASERLRLKGIEDRDDATMAASQKHAHDAPVRSGGRANSCCFHIFVESVLAAEAYGPLYLSGSQNGVADEDACQALAQQAAREYLESATGPQDWSQLVTIEFDEDGTAPGSCRSFGACCTDSGEAGVVLRGGSNSYQDECDEIPSAFFTPGDPVPTLPSDVGLSWEWGEWTRAYQNCDVCRLQFGMCCFTAEAVDTVETEDYEDTQIGSTTNDKFRDCNVASASTANAPGVPTYVQNWVPSTVGGRWNQPDMEPLPLAIYTGNLRSADVNFTPQWQGHGLLEENQTPFPWDATETNPWPYSNPWMRTQPGMLPVIGSSRLVTNNDDSSAEERCLSLAGMWNGYVNEADLDNFPTLLFEGERLCLEEETILGGCMTSDGSVLIMDWGACGDEAELLGLDLADIPNPLWQANMLNPSLLIPDEQGNPSHQIHKNQWRPTWALWFTPPTTTCPFVDCGSATDPAGVSPAFITWCPPWSPTREDAIDPLCSQSSSPGYEVPPWEYMGQYVEWTGWDPELWYSQGVTLGMTESDFLDWFPPLTIDTGLLPAHDTGEVTEGIFEPGFYGNVVKFGLTPTCTQYENTPTQGLATQRPYTDSPWDYGSGEPWWLVYPTWNQWIYGWQVDNFDAETAGGVVPQVLYPFNDGFNRWTDAAYLFDYGSAPNPDDLTLTNARYVQSPAPGVTTWMYQGDMGAGGAVPPGGHTPEGYSGPYVFSYLIPSEFPLEGDPTRGSCFFPHSVTFPTLFDSHELDGEQACYVGNYCNDESCCNAVDAIQPGCCAGTGEHVLWDPECIQVAIDLYLSDQSTAYFDSSFHYEDFTCGGITPFLVPSWPVSEDGAYDPTYAYPVDKPAPRVLFTPGQYNPDPRNVSINPYLDAVLPDYIDPTYVDGSCEVADTSLINSLSPPLPVPPDNPGFADYEQVRDQAGRLYQFVPRCQGIFSSAGQCNVPGTESGRSAWEAVADDESIYIGCQDFDCCMRVVATMLQEKDATKGADAYTDLEWINFVHMGSTDSDVPMSGQWTPYMAMKARELCYPAIESSATTPDFFPLQLHAGTEAYQQVAGAPGEKSSVYIEGPDASDVTANETLRQLIYAPLSWTDPLGTVATGECLPPRQNIHEMCPAPYYRAEGMGLWPESDPFEFGNQDFFKTWTSGMSYLSQVSGEELNPYGEGMKIAVLSESAWLQTWQPPFGGGPVQGAVHEDLENVILEGPAMGLPEVIIDFSDPAAAARGTAVLGVLAATDNGFGVTGMAHNAQTYYFPTRAVPAPGLGPQERLEDAFIHAISILDSGDVLLLALDTSSSGFMLADPELLDLITLAAASDIHVVIPAGDTASPIPAVAEFTGIENVTVVGAAVPGSDNQYLRWWTSNYFAEDDTVTSPTLGAPNICAWGGAVTTTGGNANLTLLTIDGAADVDPTDGTYQLTETGRARSYTNDFGSQLDGTIAAASQVAASLACAQSFCASWYGDPLIPSVMQGRLYGTAVYGNAGGQPAGLTVTPGNSSGPFTWDLDAAEDAEQRSIGRIPRLGRLLENLAFTTPDDEDFADEIPFRIIRMDIVSGNLEDGSRFSLMLQGDDEWAWLSSEQTGPGKQTVDFYTPGTIRYTSHRDFTDVQLTCEIAEDLISTSGFGIFSVRAGPDNSGFFKTYVFDFNRNAWRQFSPDQNPPATTPREWPAEPWPGAPVGLNRYLEPETGRMYIRLLTSSITNEDYHYYLDFVELQGVLGGDIPH